MSASAAAPSRVARFAAWLDELVERVEAAVLDGGDPPLDTLCPDASGGEWAGVVYGIFDRTPRCSRCCADVNDPPAAYPHPVRERTGG